MSDVIERLLQVEEKAKTFIEQARRDASKTVEDARQEARGILGKAREDSRAENEQFQKAEQQKADGERERTIEQARSRTVGLDGVDEDRLARAVDSVVQAIAWAGSPRDA